MAVPPPPLPPCRLSSSAARLLLAIARVLDCDNEPYPHARITLLCDNPEFVEGLARMRGAAPPSLRRSSPAASLNLKSGVSFQGHPFDEAFKGDAMRIGRSPEGNLIVGHT